MPQNRLDARFYAEQRRSNQRDFVEGILSPKRTAKAQNIMNHGSNHSLGYLRAALLPLLLFAENILATTYDLTSSQRLIGALQTIVAEKGNTLLELAKEFDLGYEELVAANPTVDPWLPDWNERLLLPAQFILPKGPREGIYINLAEYRLYYFPSSTRVMTFPISIGRGDWRTPKALTEVTAKLVKPSWYPPESIRLEKAADGIELPPFIPPGPDNPLGEFALKLALPGYLIHGTSKPYGIGMRVTHGCIRLRPKDMEELFPLVAKKTSTKIYHQPFRATMQDGVAYFESHASGAERNLKNHQAATQLSQALAELYEQTAGADMPSIDWHKIIKTAESGNGIVQPVTTGARFTLSPPLTKSRVKERSPSPGSIF